MIRRMKQSLSQIGEKLDFQKDRTAHVFRKAQLIFKGIFPFVCQKILEFFSPLKKFPFQNLIWCLFGAMIYLRLRLTYLYLFKKLLLK